MRLLHHHGYASLAELTLKTGRRVDIAAINDRGHFIVVEIKSSREDFLSDNKWPEYLNWADQFYFAVPIDFPQALIPSDQGLIIADQFGGKILREATKTPLVAARRKALTVLFAKSAARRIFHMQDPKGPDSLIR